MDATSIQTFVAARERERVRSAGERRDRLMAAAPRLAGVLRREYGVARVTLFGSLAWGRADEHADIDLFVEGLAAERYFEALGALLSEAPGPVDLVRAEDAPETLRRRVAAEGTPLHGDD